MANKFIINEIKILSSTGFNLKKNTDCTICRENLNSPSLYTNCLEPMIKTGTCGHSFHSECIEQWVVKYKNKKCPICFADWVYLS
jgi:hypothetical protein